MKPFQEAQHLYGDMFLITRSLYLNKSFLESENEI